MLPTEGERLAWWPTGDHVDALIGEPGPVDTAHVSFDDVPVRYRPEACGLILADGLTRPPVPLDNRFGCEPSPLTPEGQPARTAEQLHRAETGLVSGYWAEFGR